MEPRLASLRRLTKLYGGLEHLRRSELELAAAEAREAEAAIVLQRTTARSARFDGREALTEGDWLEWKIADKRLEIAVRSVAQLEPLRVAKELKRDEARQSYLLSRLQSEQMQQLRDAAAKSVQIAEERQRQRHADDLFLSRRRWLERQTELCASPIE